MAINTNGGKTKKLKYVRIYDKLYEMLENGIYPPGSQLPGETELSEKMNVSRMTLRKALALLNEDGIITSRLGIGHFVNEKVDNLKKDGMEKIGSPIQKCCILPLDKIETDFRIEPPSDYICDVLEQKPAAVVIANRYYKSEKETVAYVLSFIPIEIIGEKNINLNDSSLFCSFLDQDIYKDCTKAYYKFSHSNTGNFTAVNYRLSEDDSFIMFMETLYGENKKVIAVSKYYIPVEKFSMSLTVNS